MIDGYGGRGAVDYGSWDHFLRGRLAADDRWQCWRPRPRALFTPFGWLRVTGAYGLKCGQCQRQIGKGCVCDFEGPNGSQQMPNGGWLPELARWRRMS